MSGLIPDLGVRATVVMDEETNGPTTIPDGESGLRRLEDDALSKSAGMLVEDLDIVSHWTLHVALYALQNPSDENVRKALYLIGTSGDCEEHADEDTLMPLPVEAPNGWDSAYVPDEDPA